MNVPPDGLRPPVNSNVMHSKTNEAPQMKRDDPVISLLNRNDREIIFEFHWIHFAALIALFAIGFGVTLWFFGDQVKESAVWGYWFLCFLLGAMAIGFFASLTIRRNIRIDKARSVVEYRTKSIFGAPLLIQSRLCASPKRTLCKALFAGNGRSPWQEEQRRGWAFWPRPAGPPGLPDLCVGFPRRATSPPSESRLDLGKPWRPEAILY